VQGKSYWSEGQWVTLCRLTGESKTKVSPRIDVNSRGERWALIPRQSISVAAISVHTTERFRPIVTAPSLAQPLENTSFFLSALAQDPSSGEWDVFTFGTDSSLTTGPGWDNVTGLGTPNGLKLLEEVEQVARH
jgi:hypothetical protein